MNKHLEAYQLVHSTAYPTAYFRFLGVALGALLLSAGAAVCSQPLNGAPEADPIAAEAAAEATASAPELAVNDNPDRGHLYGSVELDDGRTLTGTLRWDEQEATWIHHFNGDKAQPFDLSTLDDDDREVIEKNLPGPRFEVNGHVIELARWLGSSKLQPQFFSIEFGHIAEIEMQGGERVTLTLRNGSKLQANGGSDDIGASIEILTEPDLVEELNWKDIKKVRFHAPENPAPAFPDYMYGKVETRSGVFEGFVDWDQDERYPEDELDGDVNGVEQSIRFSAIVSIENQGESSLVTLKDGRVLSMSDTNDVNSENRGIAMYISDVGKVMVPWSSFQKVTYSQAPDSLPRYADFADYGPIGVQVSTDVDTASGELVFDLDHQHQGEMLHGKDTAGLQFEIPWRLIQRLSPGDSNNAQVALKSGLVLNLGKDPDVTGSNLGIAVIQKAGVKYLAWESVKAIEATN